jgi:hypothetical protein
VAGTPRDNDLILLDARAVAVIGFRTQGRSVSVDNATSGELIGCDFVVPTTATKWRQGGRSDGGQSLFGKTPVATPPSLAALTGTAVRTAVDTGTVTLPQLAGVVKALVDDHRAYGLEQ